MIAKAIDKILELAKPLTVEINGDNYSTQPLHRLDWDLKAEPIKVKTLTGLLKYIGENREKFCWEDYFLHIRDFETVALVSDLNSDRRRETILIAEAECPNFEVNRWLENEKFLIGMQTYCKKDEKTDLAAVLKFAGTVTAGTVADYTDDGVTQKATIRVGVTTKAEGIVPSPALLRPHRTFQEVEQPASEFVFRMKDNGQNPPDCAIYEADGGAWKIEAMKNIGCFLQEELARIGVKMPVIA